MKPLLLLSLLFLTIITIGCTTTEYTLYLQDITVSGPVNQPPVHVSNNTADHPLRVTPHLDINSQRTINGRLDGHSRVNPYGVYLVDTVVTGGNTVEFHELPGVNGFAYNGQNLHWRLPSATFGLDFDYAVSKHFALSFGGSYSAVDGEGLWGYDAGIGLFSESNVSAIRFDAGVRWQTYAYEATTVIVATSRDPFSSNTVSRVGFFLDRGKTTPANFYAAFTYNTKHDTWPANIFVQLGISRQSIADYKPTVAAPVFLPGTLFVPVPFVHDERAEFSSTFFIITPGVFLDIAPGARLLAGVRINLQTEIKNSSPDTLILPLLQIDWEM